MIQLAFFQNQETGDSTTIIAIAVTIGVFVFIVIPILKLVLRTRRELAQKQDLLINGESAQAKILKLSDTGLTLNDDPQVKIQLEIYPPDRAAYKAEITCYVSRFSLSQVQSGNIVPIKIDRQDRYNLALDL